jgi:orotate phosphoribosyltransferase
VTTNCQTEPLSQDFLKILAPKFGHFRFESGHHGNLWLHVDQPFLRPSRLHPFVIELAKGLSRHGVEGVCGPFVEGAFLAQMVASALDVEFYYSERFVALERDALYPVDYRLPSGLRRAAQGKRVAIVDDVINAGSAVRATYANLRSYEANPVVVGTLLVLGPSAPSFFAERGVPLECLAHVPNELWAPAECPLCAAGMPLENATAP